jgi:hypothetical protein
MCSVCARAFAGRRDAHGSRPSGRPASGAAASAHIGRRPQREGSTRRAPASSRQIGVWASSAGNTATPSAAARDHAAVLARHRLHRAMNSWCSRCALLTSATGGRGQRGQQRDLARVVHAELDHGHAVRPARRRSSVSGTPMWLFRLPAVAKAASPTQARRMAAIICVTVVLPLLPVTAISGQLKLARQPPASCCSAGQRVGHLQAGQAGIGDAAFGQRGGRAGGAGLRQEVVGVEALAAQRDEQVARLQRAGVAVHAQHRRGAGRRPAWRRAAARGPGSVIMRSCGHPPALAQRRARATSASRRGRTPATSW